MHLRDTIAMLGEFVGLNRSPEYRLSNASIQMIADEQAAEVVKYRQRSMSTINIHIDSNNTDNGNDRPAIKSKAPNGRRQSEPAIHTNSRHGFLPKFKKLRKLSSTSQKSRISEPTISEVDEEELEDDVMEPPTVRTPPVPKANRRGSETFFGSIAVFSNHFGAINGRL
jgi:hypothetical protein